MDYISKYRPKELIKMNNETLESWVLFEDGGNYDKAEIKWY